jgi:hypothetical protein
MNRFVRSLILCSAVSVIACGHNKIEMDSDASTVGDKNVLLISGSWIKEKMKKFDIRLTLAPQGSDNEIVWLKDIQCSRGSTKGEMSMVDARHGDLPIWLRQGTVQTIIFTCDLGAENVRGNFIVDITRVYDNPSADGRTGGKVLAKNLVLEQAEQSFK